MIPPDDELEAGYFVWRPDWKVYAILFVAGLLLWAGIIKIAETVWSLFQ